METFILCFFSGVIYETSKNKIYLNDQFYFFMQIFQKILTVLIALDFFQSRILLDFWVGTFKTVSKGVFYTEKKKIKLYLKNNLKQAFILKCF